MKLIRSEMKRILKAAPMQLRPTDSAITRKAIQELQSHGLVYLAFPTKLARILNVPTIYLSWHGEEVSVPTVGNQ